MEVPYLGNTNRATEKISASKIFLMMLYGKCLKSGISSSLKSLTTKNECRNWCERAGNTWRFKVYLLHVLQQREGKRSNCFLILGISLLVVIV